MVDKAAAESKRCVLLTQAKNKRAIAAHARQRAARTANEVDEQALIDRSEQLEQEAAQLEAEAARLPGGPSSHAPPSVNTDQPISPVPRV